MERQRVSTGTEWESSVGYSRAIRAGNEVHVSGTVAADEDGEPVAVGDPYGQTARIIEIAEDALGEAGASLADVVRTRLYVTDIDASDEIGRAHGEAFGDVRPASTMIEVEGLIEPEYAVEMEFVALVDD